MSEHHDDDWAMSLRLPREQADILKAIADANETSIASEVREAIAAHIESRKGDLEFMGRLYASIERNQAILERLAK